MVSDQLQELCPLIPWLALAAPQALKSLSGSPHASHLAALGLCFLIVKRKTGSYHGTRPGPFLCPGGVVTSGIGKTLPSWAHSSVW